MSKKKWPNVLNPFWWIKITIISIFQTIADRFKALIPSYYKRK